MRITDDRYNRDWQRFDLALRLISHEARTCTIRIWTGLSDDRIRKLYKSYLAHSGGVRVSRHRGKPPTQVNFFQRNREIRGVRRALFQSGLAGPASDSSRSPATGMVRTVLRCLRNLSGQRAAEKNLLRACSPSGLVTRQRHRTRASGMPGLRLPDDPRPIAGTAKRLHVL